MLGRLLLSGPAHHVGRPLAPELAVCITPLFRHSFAAVTYFWEASARCSLVELVAGAGPWARALDWPPAFSCLLDRVNGRS